MSEDEIDVGVVALVREPLLARDEAEALAHLDEGSLASIDDRPLGIALLRRPILAQVGRRSIGGNRIDAKPFESINAVDRLSPAADITRGSAFHAGKGCVG